jgi:ABC-type multidrug transport system fused ATPase/permease subunit
MGSFGAHRKAEGLRRSDAKNWSSVFGERGLVAVAIVMTIASVCMSVVLPETSGAPRTLSCGLFTGNDRLTNCRSLARGRCCSGRGHCNTGVVLANGVVQRTMYRLRADVEDKLNRLPLSYIDRAPRGTYQSRDERHRQHCPESPTIVSQLLTQALTLIGTVAIMV